jgi:hypothetical protein
MTLFFSFLQLPELKNSLLAAPTDGNVVERNENIANEKKQKSV